MSFLRPAAASSSRAISATATATAARAFSTSAPALAGARKVDLGDFDIENLEDYKFDDAPSLGHLRLLRIDAIREMVSKMDTDKKALAAQARPFKLPKGTIRITSTIDLADNNPTKSPNHVKRVMVAPLSALPLKTPEAIQRLKILAGPRWTPGFPGRGELGAEAASKFVSADPKNEHGYVKIAEDRFPDGRMNRKAVSDTLERLVEAANDPNSPIPADTPVDMRHLLARQRKKKQRAGNHFYLRSEALKKRPEIVGGVRGFPKEWLAPEAQAKLNN